MIFYGTENEEEKIFKTKRFLLKMCLMNSKLRKAFVFFSSPRKKRFPFISLSGNSIRSPSHKIHTFYIQRLLKVIVGILCLAFLPWIFCFLILWALSSNNLLTWRLYHRSHFLKAWKNYGVGKRFGPIYIEWRHIIGPCAYQTSDCSPNSSNGHYLNRRQKLKSDNHVKNHILLDFLPATHFWFLPFKNPLDTALWLPCTLN